MCWNGSYKNNFLFICICIFVVLILKRQVALIVELDFDSYKSLRLSTTWEKQREIFWSKKKKWVTGKQKFCLNSRRFLRKMVPRKLLQLRPLNLLMNQRFGFLTLKFPYSNLMCFLCLWFLYMWCCLVFCYRRESIQSLMKRKLNFKLKFLQYMRLLQLKLR